MVSEPPRYGFVVLKGPRTRRLIGALLDVDRAPGDDGHLIACSVGGSPQELNTWLELAEAAGVVRGEDFVVTQSREGVVGETPSWLTSFLEPSGNPPELEARMEPDVRAMWERTRLRKYQLSSRERA